MFRVLLFLIFCSSAAIAQDAEPPMTYERLGKIIFALDPDARPEGPTFQMTVADMPILIVTDARADRMRAMVPIRDAQDLSSEDLQRMMQANFDTALDARYAIAGGRLWAVFIHPLAPLEKDQFISALGQTVNVARTYGTLYSGGAQQYGGGDSGNLQRELIDELLKKGEEI
ncbi:MAG: hypothetical protein AAGA05_13795 [Pseudomonadota bacterium]